MSELLRQKREVTGFHRVSISGIGNLVIQPGDQDALVIEADPDILPRITSQVQDGELRIGFKSKILLNILKPIGPVNYYLTVTELDGIKISGACKVSAARLLTNRMDITISGTGKISIEIDAQELDTTISGAGKIEAMGQVEKQSLRISGTGNYSAGELTSKQCKVRISGAGNGTVNASETLDVTISGSGVIRYQGQPTISKRVSGAGRITPLAA